MLLAATPLESCWEQITTCVKKFRRCGLEHSIYSTCFLQLHAYKGERIQASPFGRRAWLTCLPEPDLQRSIGSISSCQHVVHLMQLCLALHQLCTLAGKLTRHLHHAAHHPPDHAAHCPADHSAHCPADHTAYHPMMVQLIMQVIMQASRTNGLHNFSRHTAYEQILIRWRKSM